MNERKPIDPSEFEIARDLLEENGWNGARDLSDAQVIEIAASLCAVQNHTLNDLSLSEIQAIADNPPIEETPVDWEQRCRDMFAVLGNPNAGKFTREDLLELADYLAEVEPVADPPRIPGTFVDKNGSAARIKFLAIKPVPLKLPGFPHVTLRRYRANVDDGVLIVGVSNDPIASKGAGKFEFSFHITVSHRSAIAGPAGDEVHTRCPTYDELKRAKFQFAPPGMAMALFYPPVPSDHHKYLNEHPTTLHLHEIPSSFCF